MKQIALCLSMILMCASTFAAATPIQFKGKVRTINVSSGGFENMTMAVIEVTLDLGVTKKDNYSICQDVSEREYAALFALLVDSRSRNQDASFSAKEIRGFPGLFCITSITSP